MVETVVLVGCENCISILIVCGIRILLVAVVVEVRYHGRSVVMVVVVVVVVVVVIVILEEGGSSK